MTNYGSVRECSRDDWATNTPGDKVAVTEISNVPDLEYTRFHQLNDHILCKVIHELETIPINKRFCGEEWKTDPLKRFKQIKSQLSLNSGVLVRSYKTDAFSDYNEIIVTPECMKKDLLIQAHENGGHQGIDGTLYRLKLEAYWVGIYRDVELHVSSCETCQKAKLSLPTKAPLVSTPVGRTMQLLQVDVLEVPNSINRNRYLLVVEDAFSKWIECYPMKDQKAETITKFLVDVFARLGIPEFLHSVQGRNFESALLKETSKSLGIIKTHTTAYRPQGNALVERSNRTVLKMLLCYTEESYDWEENLPLVLFTYRTTKHATTGISPFQLIFGRDPPNMIHLEPLGGYEPSGYERFLRQRLASLKEFVEGHRVEAQRRQKEYYDKGSKIYECSKFTVGKPVLLSIPRMGVNSKLKIDGKEDGE